MIWGYIVWAMVINYRSRGGSRKFQLRPIMFTLDQSEAVNFGRGAGATTIQKILIEKPDGWDDWRDSLPEGT